MRNIVILFTLLISVAISQNVNAQVEEALVRDCANSAGDDATYLKDFVVDLGSVGPDESAPIAKFSMVLQKNTEYRFTICNSDSKPGKGVLQLFDTSRLLGSTFNSATGKEYRSFNFKCQNTGVYHVFISFQEGEAGFAVGILSFVQKI